MMIPSSAVAPARVAAALCDLRGRNAASRLAAKGAATMTSRRMPFPILIGSPSGILSAASATIAQCHPLWLTSPTRRKDFRRVILLPEQCRAARGLLDWTQEQLAERAGVARSTVRDFECRRHELHRATEQLVVSALREAGVLLLPPDSHGPGV